MYKFMKKSLAGLAALSLALPLALIAPASAQEESKQKVTLMLNWYVTSIHAPMILGLEKGFYTEEGIELEIQEGRGSSPTVQAVAANNVTIGFADMTTMMGLVAKGAPVIAIGAAIKRSPTSVVALAEKNIDHPDKIRGKTIAMTAGDSPSLAWPLLLERNGLSEADYNSVNGDARTKVNAVITGQADALLGFAMDQGPQIEAATGKPFSYMLFADFGVNSINTSFIVHRRMMESDPELLRKFMRATSRSFDYAQANFDEAVDATHKAYPDAGTREGLATGLRTALPFFKASDDDPLPPLRVTTQQVEETIETMIAIGLLAEADRDAAKYYTDAFLP